MNTIQIKYSLLTLIGIILFAGKLFAQIDQQTYNYTTGTNQLSSVTDAISATVSAVDIDSQASTNYAYDAKGQLTKDEAEGILSITWTAAGKVKEVTYADRTLKFRYDAMGNRIRKTETIISTGSIEATYYVCNATGAVMSIYQNDGSGIKRTEVPIGTGIDKTEEPTTVATEVFQPKKGNKYYQLNDHLGSARTIVSDTKQSTLTGSTYAPSNYTASIASANDYYSFGMLMPGRDYSGSGYRYGFQGKEKDDELKGNGNSYDFGARLYDARLGRWNSVDPLASQFPNKSPYNMCSNNPINRIDPNGMADIGLTLGIENSADRTRVRVMVVYGAAVWGNVDEVLPKAQGFANITKALAKLPSSKRKYTRIRYSAHGTPGAIESDEAPKGPNLVTNGPASIYLHTNGVKYADFQDVVFSGKDFALNDPWDDKRKYFPTSNTIVYAYDENDKLKIWYDKDADWVKAFKSMGEHLEKDGDITLHSCNVGLGERGEVLLKVLAFISQRKVRAGINAQNATHDLSGEVVEAIPATNLYDVTINKIPSAGIGDAIMDFIARPTEERIKLMNERSPNTY